MMVNMIHYHRRRWNLIVRNLFHKQVFKNKSGNLAWNGFKAFVISASMHEIIMTFVSRTITFEQFSFFMLQGIFIFLQITLLPKNCILPKFICIIITLITISLTAQLFLLSFVRYPEVVHFLSSSSWI